MYNKKIKYTGIRPGEKMHEALISCSESSRVKDIDSHYVISPSYLDPTNESIFEYSSSKDIMSKSELKEYLTSLGVLEKNASDFTGRTIEEHKRY